MPLMAVSEGCIYWALHENENKTSWSRYVKGVPIFQWKVYKWGTFSAKMVYKKGLDLGAEPPRIKLC